jgi:uncharacterized Zn finger protein
VNFILNTRENIGKLRQDLRLQRRGGIKVKLEFDAPQWWTVGFIRYIEEISAPKQLAAARNYVRTGKVVEMNVNPGVVEAKVQGTRKAPYHVRLYSSLPTPEQLDGIKRRLSERAIYSALLLAGEMPSAILDIFRSRGAGLMPGEYGKSRLLCSCPEPHDVCKHILAALLVVTGAFDRDPFLLLRMRGLEKEDLLASVTKSRGERGDAPRRAYGGERRRQPDAADMPPVPTGEAFRARSTLSGELAALRERMRGCAGEGTTHPPLFDFPLWRGETSFKDSMYPYYESVRRMLRNT